MSEELKRKDMDVSRSTIVQSGKSLTYGGPLKIVDEKGRTLATVKLDPKGSPLMPEHHVRAWIETEYEVKPL